MYLLYRVKKGLKHIRGLIIFARNTQLFRPLGNDADLDRGSIHAMHEVYIVRDVVLKVTPPTVESYIRVYLRSSKQDK